MNAHACPCLHTTPCHESCTCVSPLSSRGCSRCCTYGSPDQQRAAAERLAAKADALDDVDRIREQRDEAMRQLGQWQLDLERVAGRAADSVVAYLKELVRLRPIAAAAIALHDAECSDRERCSRRTYGDHSPTCVITKAESALRQAVDDSRKDSDSAPTIEEV